MFPEMGMLEWLCTALTDEVSILKSHVNVFCPITPELSK
jgi:hypothetical protein